MGDTVQEDFLRSFFGNVNDQVDMVCKMLKADENLQNGFNAIGLSQVSSLIPSCIFYIFRVGSSFVRMLSAATTHQCII